MFRFLYSANLVPEPDGGFVVTFPDFPEAITQGEGVSDSLKQAADCLEEAIAGRIRRGQPIPIPAPIAEGGFSVSLSTLFSAKTALYLKMKSDKVSSTELARRLGWKEKEILRLLDPKHQSKMAQLEIALNTLGLQLVVEVRDAA